MRRVVFLLVMLVSMYSNAMPDFQAIKNTAQRKQAFFHYLQPFIASVNQDILQDRKRIVALHGEWLSKRSLSEKSRQWLLQIAKQYRMEHFSEKSDKQWQQLLNHVDVVPMSMALAQAANESGWGTSRFARQGNNLFGQWCFRPGCGIVPKKRAKGKHYEVQKFSSPHLAIKQYIGNLNTNPSYTPFRKIRHTLRQKNQALGGYVLAQGLIHYSERKAQYVRSIRALIKSNRLEKFDVA